MAYYCEVLTDSGRERRYSSPLFVTPFGLIHAFPEDETHAFQTKELAKAAAAAIPLEAAVSVGSLATLLTTRRYRMWQEKVKDSAQYKEQRRTIEESWALYLSGGWKALTSAYTKTHAVRLVRQFVERGWMSDADDAVQRILGVNPEAVKVWEIAPLIVKAEETGALQSSQDV